MDVFHLLYFVLEALMLIRLLAVVCVTLKQSYLALFIYLLTYLASTTRLDLVPNRWNLCPLAKAWSSK